MLGSGQPADEFCLSDSSDQACSYVGLFGWKQRDRPSAIEEAQRKDGVCNRMTTRLRILVGLLCVAGMVLSGLSLQNHYSAMATDYCNIDELFNCDLVNRSVYARIFSIPVALVGLVGYAGLLFLTVFRSSITVVALQFGAALIGMGFALYLAYVEAFILRTWCLLCIGSLAAISAIALLSGVGWWRNWSTETDLQEGD